MKAERNLDCGKWKLPDGYKDLGWQLHSGNSEEIKKCFENGHNAEKKLRHFDNSLFRFKCTDYITICDECKIIWHVDMSD